LNIHRVNYVRQTEMRIAELLLPQTSPFEIEIAIEKLRVFNHQALIRFRQN